MIAEEFTTYLSDTHHCNLCHRLVDTHDARDQREVALMLLAHLRLNCTSDTELRRLTGAST